MTGLICRDEKAVYPLRLPAVERLRCENEGVIYSSPSDNLPGSLMFNSLPVPYVFRRIILLAGMP